MPGVEGHPSPEHSWDAHSYNSAYSLDRSVMMPYHRSSVHSNGYSPDGPQSSEEAPTYLMEHLATFTVAKETGIVYPADGMRRLLQLEKSNGIWSQKMQLRLDMSWVLIMDYETGAVMERFPVALIQEPTAFTSHDPMEIYNNILVFIVGDERAERLGSRSEMHIFQCQSISAQDLVEDLKLLRAGKAPARRRSRHIPPPPATPPPEPPGNGVNVREQVSVFNAAAHHPVHSEIGPGTGVVFPAHNRDDEVSSTSSEKYERDVTILNHCFDDIEKFIARLQHAAAASRELERRRRNRKSKKKDLGDGMLTMRAKPPPELEFIDIFQKFKLSFNLLAKLKAHIHDPNAPELVHFLFTPLALIVDASHDTHYGPNLPAKVVSPLLTREAVNLLINCVTSKETELWHSLGDAWLIPRDQWKGYVAPYHPVFLDGWSPEYPVADERERMSSPVGAGGTTAAVAAEGSRSRAEDAERDDSHYSSDYFEYERREASPAAAGRYAYDNRNYGTRQDVYGREERDRSPSPGGSERDLPGAPHDRDPSARSDISADSIERNGGAVGMEGQQRFERSQASFLDDLRSRGAKIVQVTYPRTANNDKELTVIRGEYLEVVDDSRKWWKARNWRGQVAHVPHTIVTPYQGGDPNDVFSNPLYAPPRGYDKHYPSQDPSRDATEMSRPARSPPIPPPAPADWVRKERLGKKEKYRQDSDLSSDEDGLPTPRMRRNDADSVSPPPPPPPPADSTPVNPRSRSGTLLSRAHSSQDLHEELKTVLTLFRDKKHNLDIVKTPEVFITQTSDPAEVQNWLHAKGFSERLRKQLHGMTGNELLSLTKSQLEKHCGKDEGRRLDSQLTVQRNVSGYKTARSSELRAILARAREKAEDTGLDDDSKRQSERAPAYGRQRPALQGIDRGNNKYTSSANSGLGSEGSDDEDINSHFGGLLKEQLRKMQNKN
ncbi:epidermal growth factor receptor kinase substrate 8-like isoform X2 [Zootermopsis nevadensis]|uniref:epidermal growth factor receptor kinase substrate 8-like isoform X2 n=1 Tax=Zootermopsis nevadensis TaxID=136037 RepID=UPI000B8EE066|nr:epidermal growth factor receptor kinase substrate 8-like isoform X2 [Zootermopsis nevadensis]